MSLFAFSDESERSSLMLVGVLYVPERVLADNRKQMRALLLPGQQQVHTSDESARRRRVLLDVVASLDVTAVVFQIRRPSGMNRVAARRVLLTAAATDVADRGCGHWALDSQHEHQAAVDRVTLDRTFRTSDTAPTYRHVQAESEPLLWAIDAVLWAWGAGGDWRRRVSHLIEPRSIES